MRIHPKRTAPKFSAVFWLAAVLTFLPITYATAGMLSLGTVCDDEEPTPGEPGPTKPIGLDKAFPF